MSSSASFQVSKILKTRVRITSYNILSESLCNEKSYPFNNPEYVREDYRFPLIKSKIDEEIKKQSIVCMQEVTQKFAGEAHVFFQKKGYHVITGLYGNHFNGNMGVVLAFPTNKYDLVASSIITVGDTKRLPKEEKPSVLVSYYNYFASFFVRRETPIWKQIVQKRNMLIAVKLKDKETNDEFVVATYHMPCAFMTPPLMTAHAALSAQAVEKFASTQGNAPFIFCGDYNFMPGSDMYNLYISGNLPLENKSLPPKIDDWSVALKAPMRSAYREAGLGIEPMYTNIALGVRSDHKANSPPPPVFSGCLDYIFMSSQWQVDGVKPLLCVTEESYRDNIQPTQSEPSDHLLISADLTLVKK